MMHLFLARFALAFLLLLPFSPTAGADVVVPSDRVVHKVNVRDVPGGSIVGELRPGQSAEYLESERHWHKVRLSSGTEGFVSKAWTRIVPSPTAAIQTDLEIHFIDVGQGDATLVVCPDGTNILVDVGSLGGGDSDLIRDYILEQLDRHERRVNALVITHPDNDHFNLIPSVLAGVPIDHLYRVGEIDDYANATFRSWLNDFGNQRTTILEAADFDPLDQPNSRLDCGPADVWILAAAESASLSPKNTMSIVLMVRHGEFEAILTGDATRATEAAIIDRYPNDRLDVEVLKIGHHGSLATSTGQAWADVVRPEVAIASAAFTNRFGHPRKEIVERLDDFTVETDAHRMRHATGTQGDYVFETVADYREAIYSTAVNGNIVVTSDGQTYSVDHRQHEE